MSVVLAIALIACLATGIGLAVAIDTYLVERERQHLRGSLLGRMAGGLQSSSKGPYEKAANQSDKQSNNGKPGWLSAKLKDSRLLVTRHLRALAGAGLKIEQRLRYDNELSMLIDITALGMRAGMAFDQAFELALRRFPGELATACLLKLEIWQRGLISREQGLRELEEQIQTVLFSRFVALVFRALRYGAPMTRLLLALSEEARRDIRIRREEEVAKAPVKMLIPTGTLILPAMLLLVLGPIMLDLIRKM